MNTDSISKAEEFVVGTLVIPKLHSSGTARHGSFRSHTDKQFQIIKLEKCVGDTINREGPCRGCPGRPYVLLDNLETSLCGYGTPSKNFTVITRDWDE